MRPAETVLIHLPLSARRPLGIAVHCLHPFNHTPQVRWVVVLFGRSNPSVNSLSFTHSSQFCLHFDLSLSLDWAVGIILQEDVSFARFCAVLLYLRLSVLCASCLGMIHARGGRTREWDGCM